MRKTASNFGMYILISNHMFFSSVTDFEYCLSLNKSPGAHLKFRLKGEKGEGGGGGALFFKGDA